MTPENRPVEDVTAGDPPVAVITGASSGIGSSAAVELVRRGFRVALVGRDPARLGAAAQRGRAAAPGPAPTAPGAPADGTVATFRADFAELDAVRALAGQLASAYPHIDVLANNAGALVYRPIRTVDGFELTIQANHLAPFLLTHLLLDRLTGRVITTGSVAHWTGALDPDDLNWGLTSRYHAMVAYGTSKQANILFAGEAARRWPRLLSASFHPGMVRTRFGSDRRLMTFGIKIAPFLRTPEEGADTLAWLATEDRDRLTSGGYYADRRLRTPSSRARDPGLAARLWDASLRAVGLA